MGAHRFINNLKYGNIRMSQYRLWQQRRFYIDELLDEFDIHESSMVSDHATALFMDLQACFCTGAWLSVIIISVSVIDAHLRDIHEVPNSVPIHEVLTNYHEGPDADWLRRIRNGYVHLHPERTNLVMNVQFNQRAQFEQDAKRAMRMTVSTLFQN